MILFERANGKGRLAVGLDIAGNVRAAFLEHGRGEEDARDIGANLVPLKPPVESEGLVFTHTIGAAKGQLGTTFSLTQEEADLILAHQPKDQEDPQAPKPFVNEPFVLDDTAADGAPDSSPDIGPRPY